MLPHALHQPLGGLLPGPRAFDALPFALRFGWQRREETAKCHRSHFVALLCILSLFFIFLVQYKEAKITQNIIQAPSLSLSLSLSISIQDPRANLPNIQHNPLKSKTPKKIDLHLFAPFFFCLLYLPCPCFCPPPQNPLARSFEANRMS